MEFGIGAIFKDEFDYILEWLAWHRNAGFSQFFIADNGSTDGTRQLLEALADSGLINLFYVPPQVGAQSIAYKLIQKKYGHKADAIAFIDADEFIFADDEKKPVEHLQHLFSDPSVGAVGINWRLFGSSGKIKQEPGLVVERFLKCSKDNQPGNRHIKSIVRPQFIENVITAHHFGIPKKFCYLDGKGEKIVFIDKVGQVSEKLSPFTKLVASPLRINHYVIKSLQEFTEKKRKRGNVVKGPKHDNGHEFFKKHDWNDVEFLEASLLANDVNTEIENIKSELRSKSAFYKKCKASFTCNATQITGWAAFDIGKPKLMVFVNGQLQAETGAFRYRPGVVTANISKDGYCGFQHLFTPPLKSGD
ncbi:MAG: glycosyltransferase family 2 protein, partial [Methylococcaceae bacterium]